MDDDDETGFPACDNCGYEPDANEFESLVTSERDGWNCPSCTQVNEF